MRCWSNDDGSVHVAEMVMGTSLFHLHEEVSREQELSPETVHGATVILGVFVDDLDEMTANAIAAGATLVHPVQGYNYSYRQGNITDPFGHHWALQKSL